MAHHIRVKEVPHINKDGSPSETKKDYLILDRTRGRVVEVARVARKASIEVTIAEYRGDLVAEHRTKHPNDTRGMKGVQADV